ncbi:MAG: hypothetical protein ACJAS3_003325 [Roseivirga sp.]|jgi:hypothetical protein
MKSTLLFIGTLLKAVVIFIGLGLTIWHLVKGIATKDDKSKKKALKYFLFTFGFTFLISIIEFLLAYLT